MSGHEMRLVSVLQRHWGERVGPPWTGTERPGRSVNGKRRDDMADLRYDVLVSDGVPRHGPMRLPDGGPIDSSPLASTLILGQNDAVLVDPPFTREQV